MDDTLVDTSESYREAIRATAAAFGVELGQEEIGAAKAAGNANNDWELTRRLLAERGVERSLAEVTARFEQLYQGTADAPGLRARERLLLPRKALAELAGRLKLGIVTGRPRADAVAFLNEQGISELFATVVTMDDAPLKPSPEPVRLALERLGVTRAWMVGDTPDDVRAARAAGVVPLGVVAPLDETETAGPALFAAGAARVLDDLAAIKELLP
jgi:HAD superfamily hydrolase (TIGR01548 family)